MKCAIYCRVSTEEQALEGHSIEAQKQELIQYCKAFEYEIYDIYIDAGFSAGTMERPALLSMLRSVNEFDVVLVWRLDRISRDMADLMKILEILNNSNVVFKSKTENFDTSTASGKLMLNMLGSFAEFERASISERIKLAHKKILNEGRWRGGSPPYGYKISDNKSLEVNTDEAEVVKEIFNLSAVKNYGTRAIAAELNRRGYYTRSGKPFENSYIAKILKNPVYFGEMIYGRQYYIKKNGKKVGAYSKDYKTFSGNFEPLIPKELFEKSLVELEKRKNNRGVSNAIPNILGGLVFCGDCKSIMVRSMSESSGSYLVCSKYKRFGMCTHHYISENRILKEILKVFSNFELTLPQLDVNQIYNDSLNNLRNSFAREIKVLEKKEYSYYKRKDRIFDLFEKGGILEEEFLKRRGELDRQRDIVIRSIEDLKDRLLQLSEECNSTKLELKRDILEEYLLLKPEFKKQFVRCLVERIEIMGSSKPYERKEMHIYYKL